MESYVINTKAQSNGDHEVHNLTKGCRYLPHPQNQVALGNFSNCQQAVAQAQQIWPNDKINGCYWCATSCHTS